MFKAGRKLLLMLFLSLLFSPGYASAEKILYHMHHIDNDSYRKFITNIENLQKGMPGKVLEIKLLLQGSSVQLLNPLIHTDELNQRFNTLQKNGVSVEVESENYRKKLSSIQLSPAPHRVQNIFSRIIELQRQGYLYITP